MGISIVLFIIVDWLYSQRIEAANRFATGQCEAYSAAIEAAAAKTKSAPKAEAVPKSDCCRPSLVPAFESVACTDSEESPGADIPTI